MAESENGKNLNLIFFFRQPGTVAAVRLSEVGVCRSFNDHDCSGTQATPQGRRCRANATGGQVGSRFELATEGIQFRVG